MTDAPPAPPYRTMVILYGALLAATVVYFGILQSGLLVVPPAEDSMMALAIGVCGLTMVPVSLLLPRFLHRTALSRMELAVEEVPDPDGSVMFRDRTPTVRRFVDPTHADREGRRVFFTPLILRLAFNESVAIFGLVLGMTGYALPTVLPFFLVSWVLFLFAFPRPAGWRVPLEARFDARFPASYADAARSRQ